MAKSPVMSPWVMSWMWWPSINANSVYMLQYRAQSQILESKDQFHPEISTVVEVSDTRFVANVANIT